MALVNKYPTKQDDDFFDIVTNMFKLIFPSWSLVRTHIITMVQLFVLPVIAYMAVLAILLSTNPSAVDLKANFSYGGPSGAFLFAAALLVLLVIYMTTVTTVFQVRVLRGKPADALSVLGASKSFVLPMLAVILLLSLVVIAGLAALILPGILAIIFFSFAPLVLVDKRRNPYRAMVDSFLIVKEHWKIVLALFLVQFLISAPGQMFSDTLGALLQLLSFLVSIAYFFLQAIIYIRISSSLKVAHGK